MMSFQLPSSLIQSSRINICHGWCVQQGNRDIGPKCRMAGRVQWFIAAQTVYITAYRITGKAQRQFKETQKSKPRRSVNAKQVTGNKQEQISYKRLKLKSMKHMETLKQQSGSVYAIYEWLMREWGAGRWCVGNLSWVEWGDDCRSDGSDRIWSERKNVRRAWESGNVAEEGQGVSMSRNVHNWGGQRDNILTG